MSLYFYKALDSGFLVLLSVVSNKIDPRKNAAMLSVMRQFSYGRFTTAVNLTFAAVLSILKWRAREN